MPLTNKGSKIKRAMQETYGSKKKAEEVFYASINKGKITGAHKGSRAKKPSYPKKHASSGGVRAKKKR